MGLKIACVTPWNVRCGIATYSQDLCNALAQEDVEVFIVRLPRFGRKSPEIVIDIADRVPYSEVDLVHVQHEYGLYQGFDTPFFTSLRTHGKPIVTSMHSVGNWDIDTIISGVSNKVIVHNKFCQDRFRLPTVIIPHGVKSATPMMPEEAKPLLKIGKDVPVVGYLGFISNYKGLESLITAMIKVPKAGLLICGGWHVDVQNDYIDRLQEWSKKLLGNRVFWTGFIPEDKLGAAYGAMDILVYPSRFATESGALMHGIAYGKAIIASDVEPFKEKEPAIMTFKDTEDLTEKINFLLQEPKLRTQQEDRAKEYAQANSWTEIAKRHVKLYGEILGR